MIKARFKEVTEKLSLLFAHPLPTGRQEFNAFCEKIFRIYRLPDMRSYREAIATMIMHLPPTCHRMRLQYFAKSIRKAQANQAAYGMIQEFKAALQAEELKAEEEAKAQATIVEVLGLESRGIEPVSGAV